MSARSARSWWASSIRWSGGLLRLVSKVGCPSVRPVGGGAATPSAGTVNDPPSCGTTVAGAARGPRGDSAGGWIRWRETCHGTSEDPTCQSAPSEQWSLRKDDPLRRLGVPGHARLCRGRQSSGSTFPAGAPDARSAASDRSPLFLVPRLLTDYHGMVLARERSMSIAPGTSSLCGCSVVVGFSRAAPYPNRRRRTRHP